MLPINRAADVPLMGTCNTRAATIAMTTSRLGSCLNRFPAALTVVRRLPNLFDPVYASLSPGGKGAPVDDNNRYDLRSYDSSNRRLCADWRL
jgi:hypothetical protein